MKNIDKVVHELTQIAKDYDIKYNDVFEQYYNIFDRKLPYEVSQRTDDKETLHNQRMVGYMGYSIKGMSQAMFNDTYLPFETVATMKRWYRRYGEKE